MGTHLILTYFFPHLTLHSVKTWEFLAPPPTSVLTSRPPLSPAIPRASFHAKTPHQGSADFDFDPRKLLRRRSSLVIADLPPSGLGREHASKSSELEEVKSEGEDEDDGPESGAKGGDGSEDKNKEKEKEKEKEKKKPPPTQFNEPDANSLLDSFGF